MKCQLVFVATVDREGEKKETLLDEQYEEIDLYIDQLKKRNTASKANEVQGK